jgi:hypothetical protein
LFTEVVHTLWLAHPAAIITTAKKKTGLKGDARAVSPLRIQRVCTDNEIKKWRFALHFAESVRGPDQRYWDFLFLDITHHAQKYRIRTGGGTDFCRIFFCPKHVFRVLQLSILIRLDKLDRLTSNYSTPK